jgi:putative ABC transport system ATP-binding protein
MTTDRSSAQKLAPANPTDDRVFIEATGLKRFYDEGAVQALRGADLRILEGEFVAIQGPSGCGKSTLLQLLGALDEPDEGEIRFQGQSLGDIHDKAAFRARMIGFVFQSFHLLPTLSVLENVQIPMLEMPWTAGDRRRRATVLIEAVGLSDRIRHLPRKLSGGERQRVAIARSLANEPRLLLADEPTGNLDSDSADRIMELLGAIHRERGMTMIMVTHDPHVAVHAARILRMIDGRMVAEEKPHA